MSDKIPTENIVYVQMTQKELVDLFRDTKSFDLTESQFEQEKTKRIQAISQALASIPSDSIYAGNYEVQNIRAELNRQLGYICSSRYEPKENQFRTS